MLTKHSSTTKDTRGCEFKYTAYRDITKTYNLDKKKSENVVNHSLYVADGFGIEAETLKDLQKKMGEI